jgi:hypothetical protein
MTTILVETVDYQHPSSKSFVVRPLLHLTINAHDGVTIRETAIALLERFYGMDIASPLSSSNRLPS